MRIITGAFVALLAIGPAWAEQSIPEKPRPVGGAQISFAGYVAGLNVINVQAGVQLRPGSYRLGLALQTAGMVGMVLHGNTRSLAEGTWNGAMASPARYLSAGTWLGNPRETQITYQAGEPHVDILQPPVDIARDPVPASLQRGTIDGLSAISFLIATVAATGRCEGQTRTFDGRRVAEATAHTAGIEVLPEESRSTFKGPALRCDLDGQQLAGFPVDAGPDDMLRKPEHSSVWFAVLQPGTIPVPVRALFEARKIGNVRLYITDYQPTADMAQFTPTPPVNR